MKRLVLAVACALLAVPAWAGSVGLMVSGWDTDEADQDVGLGTRVAIDLGRSWDLEARVTFFDELEAVVGGERFEIEATPIDLGLAYGFPTGRATPYVGLGLSYVLLDVNAPERLEDEFGFYGVGGVQVDVGKYLAVWIEGLYRSFDATLTGDNLGFERVEDGIALSGVSVNGGLSVRF